VICPEQVFGFARKLEAGFGFLALSPFQPHWLAQLMPSVLHSSIDGILMNPRHLANVLNTKPAAA
jgi:hypothetical protein